MKHTTLDRTPSRRKVASVNVQPLPSKSNAETRTLLGIRASICLGKTCDLLLEIKSKDARQYEELLRPIVADLRELRIPSPVAERLAV